MATRAQEQGRALSGEEDPERDGAVLTVDPPVAVSISTGTKLSCEGINMEARSYPVIPEAKEAASLNFSVTPTKASGLTWASAVNLAQLRLPCSTRGIRDTWKTR